MKADEKDKILQQLIEEISIITGKSADEIDPAENLRTFFGRAADGVDPPRGAAPPGQGQIDGVLLIASGGQTLLRRLDRRLDPGPSCVERAARGPALLRRDLSHPAGQSGKKPVPPEVVDAHGFDLGRGRRRGGPAFGFGHGPIYFCDDITHVKHPVSNEDLVDDPVLR